MEQKNTYRSSMNDKDEQMASYPQETGLLIPPAPETEDIYKVERFGEAILWRATIGGVAGYWLLLILLSLWSGDYRNLISVPGLLFGGAVGMLIGGILRLYYRKYRRGLRIMMRVVVGISIATLITGIMRFAINSAGSSIGSAEIVSVPDWLISSMGVGGLSGLAARPKKDAKSRDLAV
jgi:hypothetical protein